MECEYCKQKDIIKLVGHLSHCKAYKQWRDETITKELLLREYIELGKSALQIANELGFPSSCVVDKALQRFSIPKRSISQSKSMLRAIERTEETNMERHGSRHNFCKDHPSRVEWELKMFLEEGITNVFQREDVIIKVHEALRHIEGGKYGSRISKPHRKVYDLIQSNGISCINEFNVPSTRYWYDIHVDATNKIIEINGDMFHANPKKYKANDLVVFPRTLNREAESASDIWERDKIKNNTALDKGYELLILWEYDIKRNWPQIMRTVFEFVGINNYEASKDNQA